MPPQDTKEPSSPSDDPAATTATPITDGAHPPTKEEEGGGGSYWDAPPEDKLQGKTLSTMELSMLAHQDANSTDERKGRESPQLESAAAAAAPKRSPYWDWQENMRTSLSKLSLTELFFQHGKQQDDDAKGGEENKADGVSSSSPDSPRAGETNNNKPPSYWFWRNASLRNLSTASLTSLENAAKASDAKQESSGGGGTNAPSSPGGGAAPPEPSPKPTYWFWRSASLTNMSSTASLDTMEKTSRETDRMEGKEVFEEGQGPISSLQHKLRSSWRKSFQQLSSNSLSKLDENQGVANSSSIWKNSFRNSTTTESFREAEDNSAGAIEF